MLRTLRFLLSNFSFFCSSLKRPKNSVFFFFLFAFDGRIRFFLFSPPSLPRFPFTSLHHSTCVLHTQPRITPHLFRRHSYSYRTVRSPLQYVVTLTRTYTLHSPIHALLNNSRLNRHTSGVIRPTVHARLTATEVRET